MIEGQKPETEMEVEKLTREIQAAQSFEQLVDIIYPYNVLPGTETTTRSQINLITKLLTDAVYKRSKKPADYGEALTSITRTCGLRERVANLIEQLQIPTLY